MTLPTTPSSKSDNSPNFFQFEADFVGSLRCIPMLVRMKLDNCGVKLKLTHWNQLGKTERQALVDLPCSTVSERQTYRDYLQNLITLKTGEPAKELAIDPHPPWLNETQIPDRVTDKAAAYQTTISLAQWSNLTPAQRFVPIKLSRPSHENQNFRPALREFNLIPAV